MQATKAVRILHIEDDAADAELIGLALSRAGLDCDIRLARSYEECRAALEAGAYDLVLSDSHGHDFTGPDILDLVHKRLPEVPFVFFSGSFDEVDIEALKRAGARACLLKSDMDSLADTLREALRE